MASSSSSSSCNHWRYDVFPSFRGEDVRRTFVSHMLKELRRKGMTSFEDQGMKRSRSIGPELVQAIRESRVSVVVLSRNYASSSWCLDELLEILKCREAMGQIVVTIFYKVDPSDVRKQTGKFGRAFAEMRSRKTEEEIQKWRRALTAVANISGHCSQQWDNEADMIEKIAEDVLDELNATPSRDFDDLVGIGDHIAKMGSLLRLESKEARMVGIWGPAGIGKTSIARALFTRLATNFQFSIFMENVKGSYRKGSDLDDYGLKLRLQEQFLSEIVDQKGIRIHHLGAVQERLKNRKVLIVLDDVDQVEQLNALADQTQWFGPGSRIVVTTEDRQLLKMHGINHIYAVDFPCEEEALKIFSMYAFGQKSPPNGFLELAIETTKLVGYLPLGLCVMGSSLRGKSKEDWLLALPRFRTSLDGKIEKVLRVGYDSLHEKDKAIFLHIACLFNGEKVDHVVRLLADSDLNVGFGIDVLVDKSLIHISASKEIAMHYLLQEMGKEVVRRQSIHEPEKRQFLVDDKEIRDVLANDIGTNSTLGISLDISKIDELSISERAFERMRNLLFLRFYKNSTYSEKVRLHLPEGLDYLPSKLRLLHWDAYPMKNVPSRFSFECLVELRMPHSKLENLWDGIQPLRSLKLVDLSFSKDLKRIPDLSEATNIENLDLSYCESLRDLPSSIGELHKLHDLMMFGCIKLEALPTNINLASLSSLCMDGCSRLERFPELSRNVQFLGLGETAIQEVPSSVKLWSCLVEFSMSGSKSLKTFPHIPESVRVLSLSNNDFTSIPNSIKHLTQLRSLDLTDCRKLVSLPELPHSVSYLNADNCESLERMSRLSSRNSPDIVLEFGNCLKLDQETRERIQESVCEYALLPGGEVPSYFTRRASGSSLTIHLDQEILSPFSGFKACVVLAAGTNPDVLSLKNIIGISCCLSGKRCGPIVPYEWPMMFPSQLLTDHLCILDAEFSGDQDRSVGTEMTESELRFEFSCGHYKIIGCGVRLLESCEDGSRDRRYGTDLDEDEEERRRCTKRMRVYVGDRT